MLKEDTKKILEESKIVLVVRNIYGDELLKLADALGKGGIRAFEVTYDPADPDTLKRVKENISPERSFYKKNSWLLKKKRC